MAQAKRSFQICHLTVLNPALHSRIFYKEARAQQQTELSVCIVGQVVAKGPFVQEEITIFPLPVASRGLWGRLRLHVQLVAHLLFSIRAQVYQVHTPELLPLALILKWAFRAKVIYDVHEDYYLNIRHGGAYPVWLRRRLANAVRRLECFAVRQIDHTLYAEQCYDNMLAAPAGTHTVLPNYFSLPPFAPQPEAQLPNMPVMGYFGTIARNWGILETVALWQAVNLHTPVYLLIAGVAYEGRLLAEVRARLLAANLPGRFILVGGDSYVAYDTLIDHMQACTFLTGLYHPAPNIKDRIPTKFYEAMALGKPLVFTHNPPWDELNHAHRFGLGIDLNSIAAEAPRIARAMQTGFADCYTQPIPFQAYAWEAVQHRLTDVCKRMLTP
jgi:glycosyltransferase involved in cell wall biosynthesis